MQNCEVCTGKKWLPKIDKKTGLQAVHTNGNRVWLCWRCGNVQEELPNILARDKRASASVLYVDIEVSLSEYYNYGGKVNSKHLDPDDLTHEYFIISWWACYVDNPAKMWGKIVTLEQAQERTDKYILQPLFDLMDSAAIIAGHNVDGFDLKKINTRFLLNGISPVMGYDGKPKKTIDTLKIARSRFAFESNRLDNLCQRFGINGKDHVSKDDWRAILKGDQKTLNKVYKYNKGDVTNGVKLYEILAPYSGKPAHYGTLTLR